MGRGIEFSVDGGITGVGRVELLGNKNIAFRKIVKSKNSVNSNGWFPK